jgi:transcription elongation factor Elf1
MRSWYYIHNSNNNITSTNPTLSTSTYSFGVEIGGVDCGTCAKQYKSSATSISAFRNVNQRLIFGKRNFKNVSVWCHARSSSPSGTITTWVDVTKQFTIKTYPSSGIIDLQATSNFTYSSSYVYLYVAIDEEFSTKYTITNNNTNCVCNSEIKTEYEKNENITLEFTANDGYAFKDDNVSLTTGALNNASVTYSDDRKTLTLTGIIIDNLIVNVSADTDYTITITGTLKNCTCNYSNGEEYSLEKPIIISADSGYQFIGEFYFTYKQNGFTEEGTFINEGFRLYYDEDLSNAQVIELYDNYNATLKPVEPVEPVSQFTNLYLTNKDELTLLSKERYQSIEGTTVDFGNYITNLYNTPFKIPSNIVGGKSDIILGSFKTSVSSSLLISSKFIIDMGTIEVTEKYNNVYDYSNVMYVLHLPYFDKIYLDSEYVVNQSIKIEYVFDIYTGSTTVNIYSSFIDSIIESRSNIIVSQIPFIQKQTNAVIGNITTVNKNNIVSPFIEVVRNIPYNVNTIFGGETIEYGVIGDYEGFTRCENVLLNSRATNTEKEEIIKLLNEGVIL